MICSKTSTTAEHRSTVEKDNRQKKTAQRAVDMRYAPHTHAPLTVYEICFERVLLSFGREVAREAEDRVVGGAERSMRER